MQESYWERHGEVMFVWSCGDPITDSESDPEMRGYNMCWRVRGARWGWIRYNDLDETFVYSICEYYSREEFCCT